MSESIWTLTAHGQRKHFRSREAMRKYEAFRHMHVCK
jgi:hypothetical protein